MRSILYLRSSSKHPSPSRPPAKRHKKRKAILLTMATLMCLLMISAPQSARTTMIMTRKTQRQIRLNSQQQKSRRRKQRVRKTLRRKRRRAKGPLTSISPPTPLPHQPKRPKKTHQQRNRTYKNSRRKSNLRCLKLSLVSCAKIPRSLLHLKKP